MASASVPEASAAATPPPRCAPAAAPLGKLLLLAADAVLFGMVGALWVFNAASIAAVWAGGGSRAAAAAARQAALLAYLAVGSLFPLAVPVLFWKIHRHRAKARKMGSGGVTGRSDGLRQQLRPAVSRGARARPRQRGRRRAVSLVDLTLCFCGLIVLVVEKIQVLAPATSVWFAEFCPGINVTARFVASVIICFSFLPRCFSQVRALQG